MPLDTPNESYNARLGQWGRIRTVLAGEDAVKLQAAQHLPRPKAMAFADYSAYVQRAPFLPATQRALAGMVGQVFRHEPTITLPERLDNLQRDADRNGRPLAIFSRTVLEETLSVGRHGVLVDVARDGGAPYVAGYRTEDIINWRTVLVNGDPMLTLVVLREAVAGPKNDDPFATETRVRYRVLELAGRPEGGVPVYTVTVWEKLRDAAGARGQFALVEGPTVPRKRGTPLDFIPFVCIGANDLDCEPDDPPLDGMAQLNLSHFRSLADLESAVFFSGAPLIHVAGRLMGAASADGGSDVMTVGPGQAIHTELNGTVAMIQAGADSIGALRTHARDKLDAMAALGARMIEPTRSGGNPDHVDAQRLRYHAEESVLAQAANTASRGLSRALKIAAWWDGAAATIDDAEAEIALSTDFETAAMTPKEITELTAAWLQGGIGGRAYWHLLAKGEALPQDQRDDFDAFVRDREEGGPAGAFGGSEEF